MAGPTYLKMNKDIVKSRPVQGAPLPNECTEVEATLYQGLMVAMLKDVANRICTYTDEERERDLAEMLSRFQAEGVAFFTKTLPSFAKAVDKALATDTRLDIRGFKRRRGSVLPCFLHGLTSIVFASDGYERCDIVQQTEAVRLLRQIGYLFYKLRMPFAEEDVQRILDDFIDTDEKLAYLDMQALQGRAAWCARYAKNLIAKVLANVSPKDAKRFAPRHGPGAVATGEKGCRKGIFKRYYRALAREFPYEEYFYYNLTHLTDELRQFYSLEEIEAGTAKVVLVPKDSRGPRLISCEPLEYQWIQQGLMRVMVSAIEAHPLTKGYVNFADQSVNRNLALSASRDGLQCTLDMKEASDRVGMQLVRALFPPTWVDALSAARSTATRLPDGRVVLLNKFAPMGSAVCFPVEAMIFWALSTAAVAYNEHVGLRLNIADDHVYVYGDDIICAFTDHECIIQVLSDFGLLVNKDKSCTGAHFRESCGMDAYNGEDVTPVKIRARFTSSLAGMEYPSWVSYANSFRKLGYLACSNYIVHNVQCRRKTPFTSDEMCGVIAFYEPCPRMAKYQNESRGVKTRWNKRLHLLEIQGYVVRARVHKDAGVPGWSEMQRVASYRSAGELNEMDSKLLLAVHGLAPIVTDHNAEWFIPLRIDPKAIVKAYQCTLPRRCSLQRGWARL